MNRSSWNFCQMLFASTVLFSCATYSEKSREIREAIYSTRYEEALDALDKSDLATSKSDYVLYNMERGMIHYLSQNYSAAIKNWGAASQHIDALYTTSISKSTASFVTNDTVTDFEGETHEQVLLPVLSAISFLDQGKLSDALIEAKRTNRALLNAADKAKVEDYKVSYTDDILAHYLQGIIYEAKGDLDGAIIEYKKSLDVISEQKAWSQSTEDMERHVAADLGRVAEFRKRKELVDEIRKRRPNLRWQRHADFMERSEVIAIYESGKSPLKIAEEQIVMAPHGPIRISVPVYHDVPYSSRGATLTIEGEPEARTLVAQNVGAIAKKTLEERRGRDIAKMVARLVAKAAAAEVAGKLAGDRGGGLAKELTRLGVNLLGAVTETADTRSWTTLPDTIQIRRVVVKPNSQLSIRLTPDGGKPCTKIIQLKPGEKGFIRCRTFN